jgi:hypothetical protein
MVAGEENYVAVIAIVQWSVANLTQRKLVQMLPAVR